MYPHEQEAQLRQEFARTFPFLDEKQRRIVAGSETLALGYGGISLLAQASGLAMPTVRAGMEDLATADAVPIGRVRRPGSGRKSVTEHDPTLLTDLDRLIATATRGDPECPLRWTALTHFLLLIVDVVRCSNLIVRVCDYFFERMMEIRQTVQTRCICYAYFPRFWQ